VLLEQSANQCGEALDAVTVMLEEVLESSKGSADTFTDLGQIGFNFFHFRGPWHWTCMSL